VDWLESIDWKIAGIVAALLLLIPGWLLWRFFRGYFQILILIFAFLAAVTGYVYYRTVGSNYQNPAIGQHAYLIENGKYLGVVEGEADDRTRGKVWVVRPPGRYPLIYSKNRVRLTSKRTDQ